MLFGAEPHKRLKLDHYSGFLQDPFPNPDHLPIEHDRVVEQEIAARVEVLVVDGIVDQAAIRVADDVLVIIRQQKSDRLGGDWR